MHIKFIKYIDLNYYRVYFRILIDGQERFVACDGEPEDNTINRNFNDILKLPAILNDVFKAGTVPNSDLNIEEIEVDTWDKFYE